MGATAMLAPSAGASAPAQARARAPAQARARAPAQACACAACGRGCACACACARGGACTCACTCARARVVAAAAPPAGAVAAAAIAMTLAVAPVARADVAAASGTYDDPKHPGCFRTVDARAGKVAGVDGNPACGPDVTLKEWELSASVADAAGDKVELLVDFSPKGGPANLKGVYKNGVISWPDGNKWTKQKLQ